MSHYSDGRTITPFFTCIYDVSTDFNIYQDVALVISFYYILKYFYLFFCNKSVLQFFHAWCFKGSCAEYNTLGTIIQPHHGLDCTKGNPPCPKSYKSTEAYLCKYNHLYISSSIHTKSSYYLYFTFKSSKKEEDLIILEFIYVNTKLLNIIQLNYIL